MNPLCSILLKAEKYIFRSRKGHVIQIFPGALVIKSGDEWCVYVCCGVGTFADGRLVDGRAGDSGR